MPRPKSDLKMVAIKLGAADRDLLARLAEHVEPPTQAEALRQAIRAAAAALPVAKKPRRKKTKKIPG